MSEYGVALLSSTRARRPGGNQGGFRLPAGRHAVRHHHGLDDRLCHRPDPARPQCLRVMAADFRRLIDDSREITRRSFLAIAGWAGFTVASLVALYQSVKFVQPNATYEDPPAFKPVGALALPSNYEVGSTTVIIDKRVVINRDQDGFYAISLICTHLGCTPHYFPDVTSDLVASGAQVPKDPDTGQQASM